MTEKTAFGEESRRVVKNSKMLPFRFYQAYKACGDVGVTGMGGLGRTKSFDIGRSDLLDGHSEMWLNDAIDVSTDNLPDTLENTFTAIDLSGSMDSPISGDSEMARAEIASLFGAMLMKRDSDTGAFGNDFATIEADERARRETPVLEIAQRIYSVGDEVGNSTNGWKALDWATSTGAEYDRFVVFTDEQIWDSTAWGSSRSLKSAWDEYTDEVNPDAHLVICDLASYGDLSMPEGYPNVTQVSGWSSNIVDYIDKYERGDGIVEEIKDIDPNQY
jgi:60 kDa SS-A/Ro ribonucleoprotein